MDKNVVYTGQLNHRIKIIERVRVTSSTGEKTFNEVEFNEVWAKVEDVSGTEQEDGKILALNVRRYTIRYNPALELKQITDLYVNHNNQIYNIYSVGYVGHKEYIQLKCSKRD
jgi:SPP1 family predicted phage head-tail adaptor